VYAGILLAGYWALRYLLPAVYGLWQANNARTWLGAPIAPFALAIQYAWAMNASNSLWAGPISTVKMQYPFFAGSVAVPAAVARWIGHNSSLAMLLTQMVSHALHALSDQSMLPVVLANPNTSLNFSIFLHISLLLWLSKFCYCRVEGKQTVTSMFEAFG